MKIAKFLIVTAFVASPLAANATDTNPKKSAPAPQLVNKTVDLWSGSYIGGNIGSAFVRTNQLSPEQQISAEFGNQAATNIGSYSGNGAIGGVQIGYDQKYDQVVFGVQAMFDVANINSETTWPDYTAEKLSTKLQSFGSITARLGYLLQPTLLAYLKGGVALANFHYGDNCFTDGECYINSLDINSDSFSGSKSEIRAGLLVGGGFEYAIDRNWSAFVEYNYASFDKNSVTLNYDQPMNENYQWVYEYEHRIQALLFGVNYRF